ncbi:MAG TPA: amidohydrolase family protein [Burkholderiales bacterium]|nr:amidohydrolase family protein [Burkholderiales bacterium]
MKFKGRVLYTSQDKPEAKKEIPQEKITYLTGKLLIDGNGRKPTENPVLVLGNDRIKRIGTRATIKIPAGAEVIDCSNYTLMPGLMDAHIHTMMFNCLTFHNYRVAQWEVVPSLQQMYSLFHAQMCFDMGFTTLRDLGLNSSRGLLTSELCSVRDAIDAGLFEGPRMLVGGWTSITGSHLDLVQPRAMVRKGFQTADGPWELRKLARHNLRIGCDVIKTCASGGGGTDKEEPDVRNMTQEEINAIVDEAHAFRKPAAVHCFTPEAHKMAVKAGADTIEHMVFHSNESIDMISKANIYVTPTLSHRTDHAIYVRKQLGTPKFILDKMKTLQPFCYETFQKMYKAGIKIAMGTDMGYDPEMGEGAKELQLYVDLGMSPMHAIQTATKNTAAAIKMDADLGTIEKGKIADILAVDGNPAKDITVLQHKKNIKMVMKEGKVCVDRRPGKNKSAVGVAPQSWKIIDNL